MREIALRMTDELVHPKALPAVLAYRRRERERRIRASRYFLLVQLPAWLRVIATLLGFAIPVVSAVIFDETLTYINNSTYYAASILVSLIAGILFLYGLVQGITVDKGQSNKQWKSAFAIGISLVLLWIVAVMNGATSAIDVDDND